MAYYLEAYVINNPNSRSFTSFDSNRAYYDSKLNGLFKQEELSETKAIFPYPRYFIHQDKLYEYSRGTDLIVKREDRKEFRIFFMYKLRHIGIDYLDDFLEYQASIYPNDFFAFLQLIFTENEDNELIAQKRINHIKNWIIRQSDLSTSKIDDAENQSTKPQTEATLTKTKILFLAANPTDTTRIRVDKERQEIKDGLTAATNRDDFELISESAVTIQSITKAMQSQKPEIIHFSGHGTGEKGLVVEGDDGKYILFPTAGLDILFKSKKFKDIVKCVVLNACHSQEQAKVISKHDIYVVGMNDEIGDKAAIDFAVGFYDSLGEGSDYEIAFDMAMVVISSHLKDADKPELWLNGKRISN